MSPLVLLAVLTANDSNSAPPPLVERLRCVDHLDYDGRSAGALWMKKGSVRWEGIEEVSLFSDGYVVLYQQRPGAGLMDCRAKVGRERLDQFRAELVKAKVWRFRPPKQATG